LWRYQIEAISARRIKKWREATGRAYFVISSDAWALKVSFFGPFYLVLYVDL